MKVKLLITESQLMRLNSILTEGQKEQIDDFFNFIAKDPRKGTKAYVYYTSLVGMNKGGRGGVEVNPYAGKIYKDQAFEFRWEDTYKRAMERENPDHEMGKRSGHFEKVQGYNVVETGPNGLYLPILPLNLDKATKGYRIMNDNGVLEPIDKEIIKPYFRPYNPNSGIDFRLLMVDKISKINAGGKTWVNDHFWMK